MQASNIYRLSAKKSSNHLFQLLSLQCCCLVPCERSRVIRASLLVSGDTESNMGPASNAVLTELQKLSTGKTELFNQVQDLKSHLLSTDKSIEDLVRPMTDLEGHYQNILSLRSDMKTLKVGIANMTDTLRKLEARMDDAENHSWCNNLIFYGLPESTGSEMFAQAEQFVIKHCHDHLRISVDPKEIERAHRLGRRKDNRNCAITAKSTSIKQKKRYFLMVGNLRKTVQRWQRFFLPCSKHPPASECFR